MNLRLKRRAAVALVLLLTVAWLSASCGGDDDDEPPATGGDTATIDPNATPDPNASPTAEATSGADAPLPTIAPERLNEELLAISQNVLFALESAGGLREACETSPCPAAVYLQNWETARSRCERLETLAGAKESADENYSGLYDGLDQSCSRVADAMKELSGETTPEEHKSLAEEAIGDLPNLISLAIGEPE